jgi:hypothetical protein
MQLPGSFQAMPSCPPGSRATRGGAERGQSTAEFALVLPLFLLILAVSFSGSGFLNAVIGLNGAARAGAITAANDVNANPAISYTNELADVTAAVNNEEGCTGCYTGVGTSGTCAAGQSCVWITTTSSRSGRRIEVVHVLHPVSSIIPLINSMSVGAQAGAEP